jgi:membrane-associated protease RseP (regulator of RpoE activity)
VAVDQPTQGWRESLESDPWGLTRSGRVDELVSQTPPRNPRTALLRLLAVIAVIIAVGFAAGVGETILLIFAFLLCIVLHELGHFLTAKAARIKVTEFFVGFGPRLWSVRRGETEYGVKALPLGGYCRIIGMNNLEEVDPADEPRTYRQAPIWRRLTVGLAGSAMHFLIAICVLFAMFFWTGSNANYVGSLPASNPITEIDGLTTGGHPAQSPAQQAGFRLGDRVEAVNGQHFSTFDQMGAFIRSHAGVRLDFTVQRAGRDVQLFATPTQLSDAQFEQVTGALPTAPGATGFIGIGPSPVVHHSLGASVSQAGGTFVSASAKTLDAFGRLVTLHGISDYAHMLTSKKAADSPADGVRFESPVGVVRLFHQAGQDGLATVLYLLAVINLSLGIFNLIPLLPLDGGHVAIAVYEGVRGAIRRRPYHADVAKLLPVIYLALGLIVFLGASALFLDLRDLVT